LRILFWWHEPGGVLWTEILLAALALVGLTAGVVGKGLGPATSAPLRAAGPDAAPLRRGAPDPDESGERKSPPSAPPRPRVGLVRFLSVYTLLMAVVYAAIPYKTPWCALGFLHGVILLAGVGAAVVVRIAPGRIFQAMAVGMLVATAGQLTWQAYRASFVAYEDRHNPYVYSHTTSDVPAFVERIRQIARAHPDGTDMHVQVICPDDDFWPLPWYMRDFSRVGWFSEEPRSRNGKVLAAAPLIIAQPQMESLVVQYNYLRQPPGHRHLLKQLPPKDKNREWMFRPFVPITAYVRLGLWEAYEDQQEE
jgi:predicted membrane-bound mannosyltransferase